ncbi:MAG TPA: ABC transporter permease [Bacteroidales bacterium]|nr:ABC transporter permease [Bacteroidales bacterium]
MIKTFFIQIIRNIKSQKSYFIINLLGLTTGIAAFILIALWVNTELSFDNFHKQADRIYRVDYKLYEESVLEQHSAAAVPVIGRLMKQTYPEVELYTRFKKAEGVVSYEDRFYKESKVFYAESSFFSIFNFPLTDGQASDNVLDINKAVITEDAAKRYFGNQNPVGKTITFNGKDHYYISAIAKDVPANSHLKFDILFSYENLKSQGSYFDDSWFGSDFYTYVMLTPGASAAALEKKLPSLVEQYLGEFMKQADFLAEFKLQPLKSIHLKSNVQNELEINGDIQNVKFMSIIAILVLIIAFINYVNLTTSRSIERASEIGVRKAMGAARRYLMLQFFSESVVMNALAFLIGGALVLICLPYFRILSGSPIIIPWRWAPVCLLGLFILSSFGTGIIPSLYLSKISPDLILRGKGRIRSQGMSKMRNSLVVFQFAVSVILITGTIAIGKQMLFMKSKKLGFDIDQMLIVEGPQAIDPSTKNTSIQSFRNELAKQPQVKQMAISTNVPGEEVTFQPVYGKIIQGVNTEKKLRVIGIDNAFIETYDLKLLAGNNFDKNYSQEIRQVILNESALKYMGFNNAQEAIGKRLSSSEEGEATVIGVINDYNQKSLREKPCPILFSNRASGNYFSIKMSTENVSAVISSLESEWRRYFPGNPLNYFFLDSYFNQQYRTDAQFGKLFLLFSIFAIAIACLGLLGLSAYATSQRTKEIGLRKVSGATISEILLMLNSEFIKWVVIAFMVATPAGYFIMNKWLENFAYRTNLSWWIFALSGLLAFVIAFITVSWQSWKAATLNPAESLRNE